MKFTNKIYLGGDETCLWGWEGGGGKEGGGMKWGEGGGWVGECSHDLSPYSPALFEWPP